MKLSSGLIGAIVSIYSVVVGLLLWVCAELFEYSLWSIVAKDVPWYLDLCGGIVLNGINVPLAIGCAIARACGVEVPFYTP